ncbi:MAG: carboxylesterase family protein [Arachidicoccus sp.]|nr:carboxylesterase family protein [Arachidicoccus sp.]
MYSNRRFIKSIRFGIMPMFLPFILIVSLRAQEAIVRTENGYIKGVREYNCFVFKGVPYAQPPIGLLRFKAPVELKKRSDTLDCTKFGSAAAQSGSNNSVAGDENCLFLNVYTNNIKPAKLQPVAIWIHGGGMTGGSGSGTNGHAFADNDSIVTITINYRLGAFGFLELNDLGKDYASSGNNAVLDCIEALKWIKRNIKKFGGDPDNITVMGQSAGAKLASAVLVTPLSKGLINAAILESGAVQCIRDTVTAKAIRKRLFDKLKINNPSDIMSIPTDEIIRAQSEVLKGAQGTNYFGPVIDGVVYKDMPLHYISEKHPDNIRLLIGTNKSEAAFFMNIDRRLYRPTKGALYDWFGNNSTIIYDKFKEELKINNDTDAVTVPLLTQYMYQMHSYRLANAFAKAGYRVHIYRFDYGKGRFGATHGDELKYVWYFPHNHSNENNTDEELVNAVHGDWVHFIKNGKLQNDKWPLYNPDDPVIKVYKNAPEYDTLKNIYNDEKFPSSCFLLK